MAKDKLVVADGVGAADTWRGERWRIIWWLADESDYGGCLNPNHTEIVSPGEEADANHIDACVAAGKTAGVQADLDGFYWDTHKEAAAALRVIKEILKAAKGSKSVELPEWAKTALSQGWKPPKGWKP